LWEELLRGKNNKQLTQTAQIIQPTNQPYGTPGPSKK
jgi:hypothetical protein